VLNNSRWLQVLIIELVIIAALFLLQQIGGFLMQFAGIWLLFFLSWLLAFALRPLIRAAARLMPHPLAVLLVYIGLILVFVGVGIILFPQLTNQLTDLQQNWNSYVQQANNWVIDIQNWVQQTTGQHVDLNRLYQEATAQLQAQAGTIIGSAVTWLSTAASLMFNFILVVLISLYIALDGDRLGNSMIKALPPAWRDDVTLLGESIGRSFGGFLRGQLIFAFVYAVFNAVIMWFFGLNYVIVASIVAGFCMLIPLVGNFLAYAPAVLVALLDGNKPWLLVLVVMVIMQGVMMQVVGPRIMSSAVGIHPLFTVMAMLIGAQVMGIWGALFGIPFAGVIGLVATSFVNRLKEFFTSPEPPAPVLNVEVTPAPELLDPPPDPPTLQPATASATASAPPPRPPAPSSVRSSPLLRGLTRLAATARRGRRGAGG
jgi:predicted PurR-regulated permease PerM